MKSSIIIAGVVAIASAALIYNFVSSDSDNFVSNHKDQLLNSSQENSKTEEYEAEVLAPTGLSKLVYESQNINTGVIGIDAETNIDDPHDNTFIVYLDGDVESGRQAWLEYDLYGAEDFTSVSRTINDQIAVGGAFIKLSQEWSVQREKIDASELHKGDNIIRFSVPGDKEFNYIVKNVRIRFDESLDMSRRIVLNQPMSKSYYNRFGYISGFVSGQGSENAKIYANGKLVRSNQAIFEGIVDQIASNESDWKAVVTAVFADGQIISDTARFCNPSVCDFTNDISLDIAYNETTVNAQLPVHMNVPGFELNGEPGSVTTKVKMSVTGLRSQDMALPRLSMVNVTGASNGFRCLPHGNLFAKEVEVRIKYDTARIPQGYGPKDIRTFYYDESQNDWVMLPYDTVDIASCEIVSHTNHFTDFINAILKTPESPQTQAFTPTSMKDMKFADPIAHINMMSPPQANNSGSANMTFPIKVPNGRQGLQPQLSLNYSSDNGNGFLGVGWSMQIPSISVETRWGVPTYSSTFETEEYLVNGQQVVEIDSITPDSFYRWPLVHQASYKARSTNNVELYSYRVEGSFDRIIRHGSSPSTYWWEVVDKQGTRYFYGKYSTDAGVNSSCVLSQPGTGNIAYWALAEVKDVFGNYVKYDYTKDVYSGSPGNGGQQLYVHKITYTGMNNGQISESGKYNVNFEYSGGRNDYEISGKYGFLEVTDSLLTDIKFYFDTTFINRYEIIYKDGAYDKNLICGILEASQYASVGGLDINCGNLATVSQVGFKGYQFEYYEEEGLEFENNSSLVTNIQEVPESVLNGGFIINNTQSLGRSKGFDVGFGGSLCLGLGPKITSKNNSIGGSLSQSKGYLREKIQILDLNGDGLPDKIVNYTLSGVSVFVFFKGVLINNELSFETTQNIIPSLLNLGVNTSKSKDSGKEIQVNIGPAKGSASTSKSNTSQRTDYYFADINADGYVDYISNGTVFYNEPNTNGIPVFHAENGNTVQVFADDPCYFTIHDGEIDSTFNEYLKEDSSVIRRDPVKMWIADNENRFVIQSRAKRIKPDSNINSTVYYSIQLNSTVLFCDSIAPNDTLAHDTNICPVNVNRDDRIYFRMHSAKKTGYDDVFWDPQLLYSQNCPSSINSHSDPNDFSTDRFVYSEDAVIHDGQYFVAPLSGQVIIKGHFSSPPQSDSLHFMIKHNNTDLLSNVYQDSVSINEAFNYNLSVNEGDSIEFKLLCNTNVNWREIDFYSKVQYIHADSLNIDTTNPFKSIDVYPSIDMSMFPKIAGRVSGVYLPSGNYIILPEYYQGGNNVNGTVVFSAKSKRKLLAKRVITIQNGQVVGGQFLNKIAFNLSTADTVYFEYFSNNESAVNLFLSYVTNALTFQNYSQCGKYTIYPDSLRIFGNLFRGWGQFSYFDTSSMAYCGIDESKLFINYSMVDSIFLTSFPLSTIDSTMSFAQIDSIFAAQGIPDIYSMPFMIMQADRENDRWIDGFKIAYADRYNMGSASGMEYLETLITDTTIVDPEDIDFLNSNFDDPLVMTNQYGASRTVSKLSQQESKSFSFSLGAWGASFSKTVSETNSQGLLDFMDMNGDRYADVVGYDKIQYTTPQGGISNKMLCFNNIYPSEGSGKANSRSFGIQPAGFKSASSKGSTKSKLDNFSGAGIGNANGESSIDFIYSDINGDGLSDRIYKNSNSVQLSTGYDFYTPESYNIANISASLSNSASLSLGFNTNNYSWSGGINGSLNIGEDKYSLMDVNNDGLIDICFVSLNALMAFINTGNGYPANPIVLNSNYLSVIYSGNNFCPTNDLNETTSYNIGGNIAGTGGIPIWLFKITLSGYFNANYSVSSVVHQLRDINGDNVLDYVYVYGPLNNSAILVKYGIPKKVNILKKVTTPTKSSYTMDYAMTFPTRNNPQSKWVYSSLMVYDGFNYDGQNTTYYKYSYDSAYYHRMERESFGFEIVRTMQYDNFSSSGICYRTTEEKYHNDYYLFKGLKKYDVSKQGIHKYVETYYVWDRKEISTGIIIPADSAQCFGPYYPAISQEDKYFYEGQSAYQIHTRKTYRHTRFGNVREYKNYGDVAYTSDDFTATITYSYNIPSNLLAMVSQINVQDVSSNLLQRRTGGYNAFGRITSIGAFDGYSYAYTDINYDSYGNISNIQFPENNNNERLSYSYGYDPMVHTYPIAVTDYWGNTSSTVYDYKLGAPLTVTDLTGNEMHYTYYADGKLNTVTGPNEVLASIPYTIKCEYWDEQPYGTSLWAKTRHYDPINTNNEFVTVNFSDGLGRSIQSKQKATINGTDRIVVSGRTDYDAYGRAYRTSLPTDQALGTELVFYNYTPTNFATTTFDVLDRPLDQTAFDNTTVNYSYGFGQDAFVITCFETIITDPNGISTSKYTSARGLNTSVSAPMSTITMFEYDPLGTLKQSTDPEGFVTLYNYDMLGRLTSREHPDAGTTSYTYDLAGNVLTTQTQNLANNSQLIQYNYMDCRLEHIEYPQNPEMNVYYEYGTPNSGNQTGRLVKQQDASGVQTFEYGNMGELIKNIHTFVVPNGNHYTFETNWDYDSWNRMKKIVYPDGEMVSYHYDNGGKLISMDGEKNGQPYYYINAVLYNKYGSRSRIDYGNNTYAEYTYDPLNQRLVNLTSFENGGAIMQNIEYSYDNASNITSIQNTSDYLSGNLGGNYFHKYVYDDLYRLTSGVGSFQSANFGNIGYDQNLEYSASGNILHKIVNASKEIGGGIQNVGYDRYYEYNDRPHTVTSTGDFSYEWDANGNQIHRGGPGDRFLCWDEENRLMAVHETGEQPTYSAYIYDAGGERAWKLASDVVAMYINGQGTNYAELVKTLYVNPYMVVTDQEYSKHYYIEGERVCTKIGGGFGPGPNIPADGELPLIQDDYETVRNELWEMTMRFRECTQGPDITINENLEPGHNGEDSFEELQYFYHPDHLGSSSFITDAMGYATQHLQYLPFGETFVDQQNGYDSRYTFSAKEKDDETQYSYFGARYYDSDLSVWLSVDPMSDKYPHQSPYMYCSGNPIMRIDPNGMWDDEWDFNDATGEMTWKSNKGGANTQYVNNTNNPAVPQQEFNGSAVKSVENADGTYRATSALSCEKGAYAAKTTSNTKASTSSTTASTSSTITTTSNSSNNGSWAESTASTYLALLSADVATPEPSDAVPLKWVAHGVLATTAAIVLYLSAGEGNENYPGPLSYTYEPPSLNPIHNTPKGFNPNEPPSGWGSAVNWIIMGRLGYELYDNIHSQTPNVPTPPVDNTRTQQITPR